MAGRLVVMPHRGIHLSIYVRAARRCAAAGAALLLLLPTACQQSNIAGSELFKHQLQANPSGLTAPARFPDIHAVVAPPRDWTQIPASRGLFYVHQQWRSPDRGTGIGVAYVTLPLPISPQLLLFLARSQYAKDHSGSTGHLDTQWTDALGRLWFQGDDDNSHIRGYVLTRGLEAWIVYSGHHIRGPARQADIAMADRTADAVVPFLAGQTAVAAATSSSGHF
jgi:hypothetical protein